jgi:SAM-dependent methyltransferase
MSDESRSKDYYDEFSATYERHRARGYHALIDDLEVDLVRRHAARTPQIAILEAGCGTGLILRRLAELSRRVVGLDLSAGMVRQAHERGLTVLQGSLDELPLGDDVFDLVASFKVLAHVPAIERALAELVRVTRPGGHLLLEFYNRHSLRTLVKVLKQPTRIGATFNDEDVYTRFDTWADIQRYVPAGVRIVGVRGVRVLTPIARVHDLPLLGRLVERAERWAADAPLLRRLGGFLIVVLQKS